MNKGQESERKIVRAMKLMAASGTVGTLLIWLCVDSFFKADLAYYLPFLENKKIALSLLVVGIGLELYSWILMSKLKRIIANIKKTKES